MISLYDILEAADGQLFGDPAAEIFTDFCFDSRRVAPGELFVAVKTERGDGHHYMQEAVHGGALGIMCQRPPDFDTSGLTIVVMRDVEAALLRWARIVLRKFGTTVIGVTGTAGKSTTKEAIAAVLGTRYRVFRSPGSFNGRFGLPLALGRLTAEDKLAVLEFGVDHFGEMAELVSVAQPLVGVVTNISYGHSDRLGQVQNIAAENGLLIENLPENGLAVLNYDDDLVREMASRTKAHVTTVGLDLSGNAFGADLIGYNLVVARDKTGFDLRYERERYRGRWVPLLGAHQVVNVLSALAVGVAYGVSVEDGLRALTDLQPLAGRMNPFEGQNGALLVDDSNNANPLSTLAALDWLEAVRIPDRPGRLIFVMGNMDDLGDYATAAHRAIGARAAEVADVLVTEGDLAAVAGRAALDQGMNRARVRITFSAQDAAAAVADSLGPDDVVLVKGSQSARMEQVTRLLLAHEEDAASLPRQESAYDSVWTDRPPRPTWVEIDRSAIAHNVRRLREIAGPEVALMAVIKANAYGHGAIAVGATAVHNGAAYLGVASVNEAMDLREGAIDAPILVLGYTPPWAVQQAIRYNLTLTLYDIELARMYDRVAREMNATLKVHIKVDTGMTRLGLLPDQVMPFFRGLANLRNLDVEGIFTHFSTSDTDQDFALEQLKTFQALIHPLRAAGFQFKYVHAANTAAALHLPESRLNMIRVGIGLYGLNPGPEAPLPDDFRPAMCWKTTVALVKTIPAGAFVGYGNTYRTRGPERIAVIPVGYADGFRRAPNHWGYVLVGGQRAPLVGRVSMDMTTINVTNIPGVRIGDEVVLIGKQGGEEITADDVARQLGTISYEVVSTILARVPRV
ncbi:MAG: alanine racemase [Anaerolineae bacterium]|nr:alanine racemase [Anaerolineae bacterium]